MSLSVLDPATRRDVCSKSIGDSQMQIKLLHEDGGRRTFAVVLVTGDEAMHCLQEVAARERLGASQITAIGALSGAKLAYFDWESKTYLPIRVDEQVEVASLVGDIAIGPDGKPSVHVHAVLGRRDGTALAGHLQEARVRPTLEIIVTESPAHLCKSKDSESGLALIDVRA
jgi:predicted DNA-binding protein with PD1-like motif